LSGQAFKADIAGKSKDPDAVFKLEDKELKTVDVVFFPKSKDGELEMAEAAPRTGAAIGKRRHAQPGELVAIAKKAEERLHRRTVG